MAQIGGQGGPRPTPRSDVANETSVAAFQSIVDDARAANQTLYDQRDALKEQVLALNLQINDLNAQIAALETDDVKRARSALRALDMIQRGRGGMMMQKSGL